MNRIIKAVTAVVFGAVAAVTIGAAVSATSASATTNSVARSQSVKISASSVSVIEASCQMGYHVRGQWLSVDEFLLSYGVSGDYVHTYPGSWKATDPYFTKFPPAGSTGAGYNYRSFVVGLQNWSLLSSHTGTVSWKCDAN